MRHLWFALVMLGMIVWLSMVIYQQDAVIYQQRALINLMSQQPNCMGSPTVKVNILIPREQ